MLATRRQPGFALCAARRIVAGALVLACAAAPAPAQLLSDELPADMQGVDIVEKRGETVPLDLTFTDSTGKRVRFGDYMDGERPVVLVLGYFSCPVVCDVVFNRAQEAFNDLAWTLGREYRAVTVSIDHRDRPADAAGKRAALLAGYRKTAADDGWEFLTGDATSVRALADSVGWIYKYLPASGEYSHPTGVVILSPDGAVSNYLYGVKYPERQLRLSLLDAADGKVGSLYDRILLRCYHYDPRAGSFVVEANTIMNAAAIATMLVVGGAVGALVWRERRKARAAKAAATKDDMHTAIGAGATPAHGMGPTR